MCRLIPESLVDVGFEQELISTYADFSTLDSSQYIVKSQ